MEEKATLEINWNILKNWDTNKPKEQGDLKIKQK